MRSCGGRTSQQARHTASNPTFSDTQLCFNFSLFFLAALCGIVILSFLLVILVMSRNVTSRRVMVADSLWASLSTSSIQTEESNLMRAMPIREHRYSKFFNYGYWEVAVTSRQFEFPERMCRPSRRTRKRHGATAFRRHGRTRNGTSCAFFTNVVTSNRIPRLVSRELDSIERSLVMRQAPSLAPDKTV